MFSMDVEWPRVIIASRIPYKHAEIEVKLPPWRCRVSGDIIRDAAARARWSLDQVDVGYSFEFLSLARTVRSIVEKLNEEEEEGVTTEELATTIKYTLLNMLTAVLRTKYRVTVFTAGIEVCKAHSEPGDVKVRVCV